MPDITFCLLTCGEETEKKCVSAIEHFRDKIVFKEIRNVSPQVKALNQMLEEVDTPYLVPLDSDMILNPNAFERITNAIEKNKNLNWHSILFKLWDTLTQKNILALKVVKSEIFKNNPFLDQPTPDVEHYKRLSSKGIGCIHDYLNEKPIGNHVIKGPHFCYHKYRDVYMTLRYCGYEWDQGVFMGGKTLLQKSQKHFNYFMHQYTITGNKDYIYCIAGMTDGILLPLENNSKNLLNFDYQIDINNVIDIYINWVINQFTDVPLF